MHYRDHLTTLATQLLAVGGPTRGWLDDVIRVLCLIRTEVQRQHDALEDLEDAETLADEQYVNDDN